MIRTLTELDKYLVGRWRMENNFKDSSGNGNHGTPTDVVWKPTRRGMSPTFNGSSSHITIPYDSSMDLVDSLTMVAWINFDSCCSFTAIDKNNRGEYSLTYLTGNDRIYGFIGDTGDYVSLAGFSDYKGWHMISISASGGENIQLYIDGIFILQSASGFEATILNTETDITIGTGGYGDSNGHQGPTAVFKTKLVADEHLALYNATKYPLGTIPEIRSFTHRLTPQVDNSAAFATNLHTKSGYDLVDLSGNGNNGTVVGAARTGGYITDGMRLNGTTDYIAVGDIS